MDSGSLVRLASSVSAAASRSGRRRRPNVRNAPHSCRVGIVLEPATFRQSRTLRITSITREIVTRRGMAQIGPALHAPVIDKAGLPSIGLEALGLPDDAVGMMPKRRCNDCRRASDFG